MRLTCAQLLASDFAAACPCAPRSGNAYTARPLIPQTSRTRCAPTGSLNSGHNFQRVGHHTFLHPGENDLADSHARIRRRDDAYLNGHLATKGLFHARLSQIYCPHKNIQTWPLSSVDDHVIAEGAARSMLMAFFGSPWFWESAAATFDATKPIATSCSKSAEARSREVIGNGSPSRHGPAWRIGNGSPTLVILW